MALSQGLHQKLLQKLSPQQIQLMKLLQVPTANLEERIKEELEENPALELAEPASKEDAFEGTFDSNADIDQENGEEGGEEVIDLSDYIHEGDDEVGNYRLRNEYDADAGEQGTAPVRMETSFFELLMEQLGMLELNERDSIIAEQIIGSVDDDGYLRRDTASIVNDLAFRQNIETTNAEVEALIARIQGFDPPGICARDLKECLLLQLRRKPQRDDISLAIKVLEKYFEEFTKKHYDKIQRSLLIDDEHLKEVIDQIIRLNPKPGGSVGEQSNHHQYVIPDFYVTNQNGKLELTLNALNAPELRISEGYRDMLKEYERGSKKDKRQKEAVLFIKQKMDAAKWFIDAIRQRQHTLISTMQTILDHQKAFFLTGDETTLRPMILKDIAAVTGLDISTVSRVASSKFVQTEFGTYRLKFFFNESLSTESGEEVSTREVKKILFDMVAQEDKHKPISDEQLTSLLQEKGYNIARRTVAKYREQLNIPVARLRKEL